MPNFNYVLKESTDEYFLWAADAEWDETFMTKCIDTHLESNQNIVAMTMETQYTLDGEKLDCYQGGEVRFINIMTRILLTVYDI